MRQVGHYRWMGPASGAVSHDASRGGGPARAQQAGSAGPRYVHERYSRDLEDGCEYRAEVRGTVTPRATAIETSSSRWRAGTAVNADLTVNSSLHCPSVPRVQAPARRVHVRDASAAELAQRVSERAGVRAVRGSAGLCDYAPRFAFREDTLANTGVTVACERSRRELP